MKKKKILFVVNRFYPEVGGAELNTYLQAKELTDEYEVSVICPERTESSLDYKDKFMKISRTFNLLNPMRKFPYQGANTLCPGVFIKILFGGYDSVLCYPAPSYNSYLALLACFVVRIPCLLISYDLHDYAKLLKEGVSIGDDISKLGNMSKLRKFFVERFSHVFAISNREINYYKKFNPSVSYSPVAIDFTDYQEKPDVNKDQSKTFKIVMIGRVSYIKGQDIGLEGFKKLRDRGVDAKLTIVGRTDFEESFFINLKAKVQEYGFESRVEFTGAIERERLLKLLREAHVHLIPVRFMNSGAVVVESLASETFVVQSDMVDPCVLYEGEDGLTFKTENIEDLGDKLHEAFKLISNKKVKMEQARERVLSKFNYGELARILKERIEFLTS